MSAQIIFLTHFLGIVAGIHAVNIQVSGPVTMVRLMIGGREVAVMREPPWRANVDLGPELTPRELTAIGFDAEGRELVRTTQLLNVPRPVAEFDIALERAGEAPPTGATLRWRHLMNLPPQSAKLTLDGKRLTLDKKLHARLPKLDLEVPHVLAAQIHFVDDFLARRELVIEGYRSDSVGTELTPIAVRETAKQHPASWTGCLARPDGRAVRTAAVENPRAVLIVVREPDRHDIAAMLKSAQVSILKTLAWSHVVTLGKETVQRMIWPVGEQYKSGEQMTSLLFPPSKDFDSESRDLLRFLMLPGPTVNEGEPLRFADAVAVAGVGAVTGGQRRAVVLILGPKKDSSLHGARAVRRYLQALGVPFFVWSPLSPRPDAAAIWGEIDDISTLPGLTAAADRVRRVLDEQRIAWVDVDPLTALSLEASDRCGIEMVAR